MTDKKGFEYEALLKIQGEHLGKWEEKLDSILHQEVRAYVLSTNRCATQPEECHRVYRGQDLVEIILQWPDVREPYPKPQQEIDEV